MRQLLRRRRIRHFVIGKRASLATAKGVVKRLPEAVAVFDVGKSNAKLSLVDLASQAVLAARTTPNVVRRDGPYPHFDVDGLWDWLVAGLSDFSGQAHISAISTTTHGACFALTAGDALALPDPRLRVRRTGRDRRRLPASPRRLRRDALARPPRRPQRRPAALLAAAILSRRLRPHRRDPALSAVLGLAADRRQGRGGDLLRRPHRSLEPARRDLLAACGTGRLGRAGAAADQAVGHGRHGPFGYRASRHDFPPIAASLPAFTTAMRACSRTCCAARCPSR